MSQSLREGGEAILKFYIRRAYKLCPAIWERSSAGEQYIICIMTALVQIQPFPQLIDQPRNGDKHWSDAWRGMLPPLLSILQRKDTQ